MRGIRQRGVLIIALLNAEDHKENYERSSLRLIKKKKKRKNKEREEEEDVHAAKNKAFNNDNNERL